MVLLILLISSWLFIYLFYYLLKELCLHISLYSCISFLKKILFI